MRYAWCPNMDLIDCCGFTYLWQSGKHLPSLPCCIRIKQLLNNNRLCQRHVKDMLIILGNHAWFLFPSTWKLRPSTNVFKTLLHYFTRSPLGFISSDVSNASNNSFSATGTHSVTNLYAFDPELGNIFKDHIILCDAGSSGGVSWREVYVSLTECPGIICIKIY